MNGISSCYQPRLSVKHIAPNVPLLADAFGTIGNSMIVLRMQNRTLSFPLVSDHNSVNLGSWNSFFSCIHSDVKLPLIQESKPSFSLSTITQSD